MTAAVDWALVEAMGHRSHHGRVSEEQVAGKTFLRVDGKTFLRVDALRVNADGVDEWTVVLYSPDSIYSLRPLTEEQVRAAVQPWRPRELTVAVPIDDDDDEDDDEDLVDYGEPI